MKTTTNPGTALKKLNDDFSNIEEVYTEMRNEWQDLNPEGTEIDFLDSFDFSNGHDVDTIDETQFKPAELANLRRLGMYLGKKRSRVKRLPVDYYNQYLKNGRFNVFLFLKPYKKNEFREVISEIEEKKKIFLFIFDRLDEYGRIELQDDFIQNLETMRDLQEHTKYKTIINNLIAEIEAASQESGTSSPQREESKLSLNQIALIHCYKNEPITRDNGKEIAASHGYTAKTSGEKLYQNFTKYYNATDRKGNEGTERKNQNKIELLESVVELLPADKQSKAIDEVSILKNIQKTEYN